MILTCVRSHLVYLLSSRHLEEVMQERGGSVVHATINRRVLRYSPLPQDVFHRRKRPVWVGWRLDETLKYCWRTRGFGVHEWGGFFESA
jgi:putative transposase